MTLRPTYGDHAPHCSCVKCCFIIPLSTFATSDQYSTWRLDRCKNYLTDIGCNTKKRQKKVVDQKKYLWRHINQVRTLLNTARSGDTEKTQVTISFSFLISSVDVSLMVPYDLTCIIVNNAKNHMKIMCPRSVGV